METVVIGITLWFLCCHCVKWQHGSILNALE